MDIARLNMRSQMAQLNLDITPPRTLLKSKRAELSIETTPAKVELQHVQAQVHIDFEDWRYTALGHKTMAAFARDVAKDGARGGAAAIDRIVSEGNLLAAPPGQGASPAEISANATFDPYPEVELATVAPPNISYTPGRVEVNYIPGSIRINATEPSLDVKLERGAVKGYVDPKQSLTQWVTMNQYDIYR